MQRSSKSSKGQFHVELPLFDGQATFRRNDDPFGEEES